jgi:hypothetical protein
MCGVCQIARDAHGCRHCDGAVCEDCGVYVDGRWEHTGDCPAGAVSDLTAEGAEGDQP